MVLLTGTVVLAVFVAGAGSVAVKVCSPAGENSV
jgi:hypothetical protein